MDSVVGVNSSDDTVGKMDRRPAVVDRRIALLPAVRNTMADKNLPLPTADLWLLPILHLCNSFKDKSEYTRQPKAHIECSRRPWVVADHIPHFLLASSFGLATPTLVLCTLSQNPTDGRFHLPQVTLPTIEDDEDADEQMGGGE